MFGTMIFFALIAWYVIPIFVAFLNDPVLEGVFYAGLITLVLVGLIYLPIKEASRED